MARKTKDKLKKQQSGPEKFKTEGKYKANSKIWARRGAEISVEGNYCLYNNDSVCWRFKVDGRGLKKGKIV